MSDATLVAPIANGIERRRRSLAADARSRAAPFRQRRATLERLARRSNWPFAAGPIGTLGVRSAVGIIDTLFVRAAQNARPGDNSADGVLLQEREDFIADHFVVSDIGAFRDPLSHLADAFAIPMNDADSDLGGDEVIWPVERDGADGIALKAPINLPTKPISW